MSVLCFPDKLIMRVRLAAVCNNFGLSFATVFQKSTLTIRAERACCQLMFCQGHQQNVSYVTINFVLHFNFILMISNDMKKNASLLRGVTASLYFQWNLSIQKPSKWLENAHAELHDRAVC